MDVYGLWFKVYVLEGREFDKNIFSGECLENELAWESWRRLTHLVSREK